MNPKTKQQVYPKGFYEAASAGIMSFVPVHDIHHLSPVHTRYVEAHHFCSHRTSSFHRCVIYDSDKKDAKLIGIEYTVSEYSLPENEKKYWHSHKCEVGLIDILMQDVINDIAKKPAMLELQKTYGKTIHTWAFDESPDLPLGPPRLTVAYTSDAQLGISSETKRKHRQGYLPHYEKDINADQWGKSRTGIVF
ncbi:hypothetical protein F5I97DRAFT_1940806 [Phlebopus sp. FC_14]|nr:hypothetical protein F5I97DRAFT_1940806 [Phlebopus sp. FC_14]